MKLMTLKTGHRADMVPTLEGVLASKYSTQIYVDGGAQVCVLTQAMMEKIGAKVSTKAHIRMRMANHKKAKCLGIAQGIKVKVLDIDCLVDFYVIEASEDASCDTWKAIGLRSWYPLDY